MSKYTMNRHRSNDDQRYIVKGPGKLKPASFDLLKGNDRYVPDHHDGFNPKTGKNENVQVVSVSGAKTRSHYDKIGNTMFRTPPSRISQVDRLIPDVSVKRALGHKLASSKIRRDLKAPIIDNDIIMYKKLLKEKIHQYQDSINKTYVGDERRYLNPNQNQPMSQMSQNIPGNLGQNVFGNNQSNLLSQKPFMPYPGQNQPVNDLNNLYTMLGRKYGIMMK